MGLYQNLARDIFSEHFSLFRAQFSDHYLLAHNYHQQLNHGGNLKSTSFLEEEIRTYLLSGSYDQCLNFIDLIPKEKFKEAPIIFIYQAIAMLFSDYPAEEIQNRLFRAEEICMKGQLEGELTAVQALFHSYLGDQKRGVQLSLKALCKIPHEKIFFRHLIERNLGIAYTLNGQFRKAAKQYENLLLSSHKLRNLSGILNAYNNLTYIRKVQGRFLEAGIIFKKALNFIKQNQLENNPYSIKIMAGYGHLLIQQGEIEKAKLYLCNAIQVAKKFNILMAQQAYQNLSEVFIREHDFRSALANIQECRKIVQQEKSNYFQVVNQFLLATEARIHFEAGRLGQARSWLESSGFGEIAPQDLYSKFGDQLGYMLPIAVNIYLAQKEHQKALVIINASIPKYLHSGANAYLIRALNAQALTYHQMGDTRKAIDILLRAIELGRPENNFGDFIFIGSGLIPLLNEILENGKGNKFCIHLLDLFSAYAKPETRATHPFDTADSLSKRELEVLQLIAKGMTNREIAGTLFLSANTIKSHSIKIYRKLDVNSRKQAVIKARQLGVLPSKYASLSYKPA